MKASAMIHRSARFLLNKSNSISPFPNKSLISASQFLPKLPTNPRIPSLFTIPLPKSHLSPFPVSNFRPICRPFSNGEPVDHSREVDEINLKFAEAREEIESAMESKETVYFDEEAECAREAVKVVLDMFDGLLAKLPENERMALQRSMGLKIQQLKAEIEQLNE